MGESILLIGFIALFVVFVWQNCIFFAERRRHREAIDSSNVSFDSALSALSHAASRLSDMERIAVDTGQILGRVTASSRVAAQIASEDREIIRDQLRVIAAQFDDIEAEPTAGGWCLRIGREEVA